VHPQKPSLLKELVNRLGAGVAHPKHGPQGVGARSQMPQGAQKLKGVALLLEGVGLGIGGAENRYRLSLQFHPLPLAGGLHQLAGNFH
jgi:hypothetical protein